VDGELGVWNQMERFTSKTIDEGAFDRFEVDGKVLPVLDTISSPGSVHSKQWAKRLDGSLVLTERTRSRGRGIGRSFTARGW
jgi:hypothetical protein